MKKITSILAFLICAYMSYCQQVIASSGGFTSNGSVSLSTTVGETVVNTNSVGETTLTQGFQQPDWFVVTNILEVADETLRVNIYPNPTNGNISIDLKSANSERFSLLVTDITGKTILRQNIFSNTINSVNLQTEANGQYLFGILDSEGAFVGTHHVQKIQ